MGTAAVVGGLLSAESLSDGVLGAYVLFFSVMICCYEAHIRQISEILADNCGFLFGASGRALFLVLVGLLCFSFGVIGIVSAVLVFGVALANIVMVFRYPELNTPEEYDELVVPKFAQDALHSAAHAAAAAAIRDQAGRAFGGGPSQPTGYAPPAATPGGSPVPVPPPPADHLAVPTQEDDWGGGESAEL